MNFKSFSQSLEQFFVTVGQKILVTKYHCSHFFKKSEKEHLPISALEAKSELGKFFVRFWEEMRTWQFTSQLF